MSLAKEDKISAMQYYARIRKSGQTISSITSVFAPKMSFCLLTFPAVGFSGSHETRSERQGASGGLNSLFSMARRKRSSKALKKAKLQSATKQNQQEDEQMKDDVNLTKKSYHKQTWKQASPCFKHQSSNGSRQTSAPMEPSLTIERDEFLRFQSADRLAERVFNTAKCCPVQLKLNCAKRGEEIRDALLKQFHRWPEMKISHAVEQYLGLSQMADKQCRDQVKLYIEELREKLHIGANALFWQPMLLPEPISRQEVREVLTMLLEELKSVDGVYEQLMKDNERAWDILTLPLKLEPLLKGVCTLIFYGHEIAANEAMSMLIIFAEQHLSRQLKASAPIGLSVLTSVGTLAPQEVTSLCKLPDAFRQQFLQSFSKLVFNWCLVVDQVLNVLGRHLASRWILCEQAPIKEKLKNTIENDLQCEFARLSHVLATDQLYAIRKARSSTDKKRLEVSVSCDCFMLLVQLSCGNN